jgi:hypothetical protein
MRRARLTSWHFVLILAAVVLFLTELVSLGSQASFRLRARKFLKTDENSSSHVQVRNRT